MTNLTNSNKKTDWKKYAVFAGMGLLFAGAIYMIFMPSSKDREEQSLGMGLNMEIPAPARSEMFEDKRTAYEQELVRQMQQERMKTLDDFTALVNVDNSNDDLLMIEDKPTSSPRATSSGGRSSSSPAQSSVNAYRDVNRTLGSFYEQPKEDPEKERLREELAELKNRLDNQPAGSTMEEQLALMEKSYEMAARYLPGGMGTAATTGSFGTMGTTGTAVAESASTGNSSGSGSSGSGKTGKTDVVPVTGVRQQVVSALSQQMSDAEFVATYSQERNIGFFSPENEGQSPVKNTIRACIHDDQTVSDGLETQRSVRIRLTEPLSAGGTVIPAHTLLTGQARIGERLDVSITSIEYMGRIYATDITVYDVDGQRGIAIPPSLEANAIREVAANMGSTAGTSITFTQSAGQQLAADMGRGVIQGTSQYAAKKLRVIKIHLKAGHHVFLLPN